MRKMDEDTESSKKKHVVELSVIKGAWLGPGIHQGTGSQTAGEMHSTKLLGE